MPRKFSIDYVLSRYGTYKFGGMASALCPSDMPRVQAWELVSPTLGVRLQPPLSNLVQMGALGTGYDLFMFSLGSSQCHRCIVGEVGAVYVGSFKTLL